MNQRINSETGYPMSTDKQIAIQKETLSMQRDFYKNNPQEKERQLLKELGLPDPRDERTILFDNISQYITGTLPAEAQLHYKMGLWDEAENEYLKFFYLSFWDTKSLRILYSKENRFRDALYILNFTNQTISNFPQLFNPKDGEKIAVAIAKMEKKVEKNKNKDMSRLTGQQKVLLSQLAADNFIKIKNWINEISE